MDQQAIFLRMLLAAVLYRLILQRKIGIKNSNRKPTNIELQP